nr:SLC13 family permease [Methanocalculus taiwanensis]
MVAIACRQVGRVRLPIWSIMLGGAGTALLTGSIGLIAALHAINCDIMLFLFGVFIIGAAMEESGYLTHLATRIFASQRSVKKLIFLFIFTMGAFSALLMNDTLAIIGTPIALVLARSCNISDRIFLLALAGAITTGSVASPIGNPQNLLIALSSGMANPFLTFPLYLAVPTLISCLILYYMVVRTIPQMPNSPSPIMQEAHIQDPKMAALCKISLALLILLIALRILLVSLGHTPWPGLSGIALIASLPIIIFSRQRLVILKKVDYATLVFFIALFILMAAVFESGAIQSAVTDNQILSIPLLIAGSLIISQIVSNVPFVALLIPMLIEAGAGDAMFLALAAGSTIAGNMTILGAASNIIIIQNAEHRGATITFMEFLRFGIPVTILQAVVFLTWFLIIT